MVKISAQYCANPVADIPGCRFHLVQEPSRAHADVVLFDTRTSNFIAWLKEA